MPQHALAAAILACAATRESSFDKDACENLSTLESVFDYNQFYRLTLRQACEQTAPDLAEPVYLLLQYTWNDALDWATETIGVTNVKPS